MKHYNSPERQEVRAEALAKAKQAAREREQNEKPTTQPSESEKKAPSAPKDKVPDGLFINPCLYDQRVTNDPSIDWD